MSDTNIRPVLSRQKALVVGIANDQSIAYGYAKAFQPTGADLAGAGRCRTNERMMRPEPKRFLERLFVSLNDGLGGWCDF